MFNEIYTDITGYSEDHSLYNDSSSKNDIIQKLNEIAECLFSWFTNSDIKANVNKCHFLLSCKSLCIQGPEVKSSTVEKLLGVHIDHHLTFETNINTLCKKAAQKLNALAGMIPCISQAITKLLLKTFVTPQFSYCPFAWMFHGRQLNNRINSIHERALRLVY